MNVSALVLVTKMIHQAIIRQTMTLVLSDKYSDGSMLTPFLDWKFTLSKIIELLPNSKYTINDRKPSFAVQF